MQRSSRSTWRWTGTTLAAFACTLTAYPSWTATLSATITNQVDSVVPDAVVYALPSSAAAPPWPPKPATVDQVNKEFVPFVMPVQVGAAVTFPNKDNIRHHVYSFSPAKPLDLKLYSGVPAKPVVFDKPGAVALGCNIHDWMIGYVYVVDTPWFAKSGQNGIATIELPAGEYEVKAWHPWRRGEPATQKVKVDGRTETRLAFKLELTPPPATPAQK